MDISNSYIFYHATSSLFIENIINKGLNIDKNWLNTKGVLINILSKLYSQFPEIERCYSDKNFISGIIAQTNQSLNTNYSHEHIYINFSKEFCLNHLFQYKYGSEILSIVRKFYENEKYSNWLNNNFLIEESVKSLLTIKNIKPYIVKISINKNNVFSIIEFENGDSAKQYRILFEMESSYGSYRIKKEKLPYKITCCYEPTVEEINANGSLK
jgi:hypothetical protein